MKLWIKEPLAIFTPGLDASAGLMIENGVIAESLIVPQSTLMNALMPQRLWFCRG